MKKHGLFYWLMLPPALVLCLASLTLVGFLLSKAPALVVVVAFALLGVAVLWFFLVRRRGSVLTGSESSLMGRQTSKEGLL
jgi:uncharacterized membrane protein YesL